MSNKVWSWFKKVGHYIAVGAVDAEKFLAALSNSKLITLVPGIGTAVSVAGGILEKILAGNMAVEAAGASLAAAGTPLTSAQKLSLATPESLKAFVDYANAAGLKITDMSKATQIAAAAASLGADFLNILEPAQGDKLPTPNVPATPTAPKS